MGCTFVSIVSHQEPTGHPWLDPETCVMFYWEVPDKGKLSRVSA